MEKFFSLFKLRSYHHGESNLKRKNNKVEYLMHLFLCIFLISRSLPQLKINSVKPRYKLLWCAWMSKPFNKIKNVTLKSAMTYLTPRKAFKNRYHLHLHFPNEKWKRNKCGLITFQKGQDLYHNSAYCTRLSNTDSHCTFWKIQNIYTEQSKKTPHSYASPSVTQGLERKKFMSLKYRKLNNKNKGNLPY